MEELGEFDDSFEKAQDELRKKQLEFEKGQRDYEENAAKIDAAERKKNKIFNWIVIGATFCLVLFLAYILLF